MHTSLFPLINLDKNFRLSYPVFWHRYSVQKNCVQIEWDFREIWTAETYSKIPYFIVSILKSKYIRQRLLSEQTRIWAPDAGILSYSWQALYFILRYFLTSSTERISSDFYYGDIRHFVFGTCLQFELDTFYTSEGVIWHAMPYVSVIL